MKIRVHAGKVDDTELNTWKIQMKKDGFDKLWTWICWIVRQHIQQQNRDNV